MEDFQYAATATGPGDTRYIMGRMDQQTVSTTLRLDWNISPELALSYYGSPFASTGRFSDFKLVTRPRAGRYEDRFQRLGAAAVLDASANQYRVGTGDGAYAFANPDFSWREFNSNLVLRWEFRAGSTLYLVWSQNRATADLLGDFSPDREYRRLFAAHPDNTFLLKVSYWFSI